MKRYVVTLAFLLMAGASLLAQSAGALNKLVWDQGGADLASVQAYAYKYYPDGATTGTPLASVICTGTASPFTCQVNLPAFTTGPHSLQITASNLAGESPKSATVSFTFVVIPSMPASVRIE